MRFDDLKLMPLLLQNVQAAGYETPTPIQQATIPLVLAGKDVLGCAQTGTGKTAAFALPIIQQLAKKPTRFGQSRAIRALILTPTRELAQQIYDNFVLYGKKLPVYPTVIFGGVNQQGQVNALHRGADVVIACPGRLWDLMNQGFVHLDKVETFVLDEADRMLDMGFIHDVTRILDKIPSRRNLGMFSATISREVMDISWVYQRDPEEITVRADEQNKPDILQYAVTVEQTDKVAAMARIIRQEKLERVMVFCNTKGMVERLTKYLEMEGLDAACIHGDIPQKKREQVMARFRRGELPVFVATDVAARGIDVDDVDAVFNYDVPQENEYYVHRIGRTGRAKRHGVAYTLVADYPSKMRLDAIAKFTGNDVKPAHFEGDTLVVDAK